MLERTKTGTIVSDGSYEVLFQLCKEVMEGLGGKLVEEDKANGILEARWRYGINLFGMRVRALFTNAGDGKTEIAFKGRFADAIDSTGAAGKRAGEVENKFISEVEKKTGSQMTAPPAQIVAVRGKSKALAGVLALLFGGLAIHRVYLRTWGIALIYLLVLLPLTINYEFPFSIIVSVLDAIYFFAMSQTRFERRYSRENVGAFTV